MCISFRGTNGGYQLSTCVVKYASGLNPIAQPPRQTNQCSVRNTGIKGQGKIPSPNQRIIQPTVSNVGVRAPLRMVLFTGLRWFVIDIPAGLMSIISTPSQPTHEVSQC